MNIPKLRNNTSGYKGVSYAKRQKKWVARTSVEGRDKHLGYFNTPELAYEFYCLATEMLHGSFANNA